MRNLLSRLSRIRLPRWSFVVLGLLLVALLIWFVGPLISIAKWAPLSGWISRTAVILLMLLGAGGWYLWRRLQARRRNAALMKDLGEAPPPEADLSREDIAEMEERARKALDLMKTARVGKTREFVYELPWYVIIGPPGAGKTTALQNSGLQFPVAQELGAKPLRGIGGTTTTEWWFTDQAVLIDTAGRYTTQDSHEAADAKAWSGFLDLLKRYRPRQPLTGIIVAISVADLVNADEREAAAHGRAVRQRISEISKKFGVRPPVYLVLTKMDLMAGFTEFFDDVAGPERDQVWGHTFDIELSRAGDQALAGVGGAFDGLVGRLNDRLLARVQAEQDMQRRSLIFGFPQQFAALRQPLLTLLQLVGRETKFEPTPMLRGVYFTSATQFGRPIDRLMGAISAQFALPAAALAHEGGRGRSYFLRSLLSDVIFKEGALAGRDPASERRRKLIRMGAAGAAGLALVLLSAAWVTGYVRNAHLVRTLEERGAKLKQTVAALPSGDLSDSDLLQILPALQQARSLPFASTAPQDLRTAGFSFGVGRDKALRPQVDAAYRGLLNREMLPRLVLDLEDKLRAQLGATGAQADTRPAVYNLLRTYLMVGRSAGAPLEAGQIETWFANDWADRFAGAEYDGDRAALQAHLATLLSGPMTPPSLDRELIAQARSHVTSLGPGERAYARLKSDPKMAELAPFSLTDVSNVGNSRLFARRSGKPLGLGVPGLYRRQAFYTTVMPAIAKLATQSANEAWVTGEAPAAGGARSVLAGEAGRIKDGILVAYLQDFTQQWDAFIDDITISGELPVSTRIRVAVQPPSPVKQLIQALASETDLTPPVPPTRRGGAASGALRVGSLFSRSIYRGMSQASRVDNALNQGPQGPPGPLDEVIEHFRWLREMTPAQGPSPLDGALTALGEVSSSSTAASAAAGMGDPLLQRSSTASAMGATANLNQVASALPPMVGGLFTGFIRASTVSLNKSVNQSIQTQYATQLLPECRSIVSQGFPFSASPREATVDDFSRLLRPGGLMDQFTQTNLSGMVDARSSSWSLTPAGRALGLRPDSLRQFRSAEVIRRAYFQPGDIRPNVRFLLEPVQIGGGATSVTLTVDGVPASFDQTNRRAVEMRWPGPTPGVTIAFQGPGPVPSVRSWSGDFALPRMIRDGRITRSSASGLTFQTGVDAYQATFSLRFVNTSNPFTVPELRTFRCPDRL